MSSSNVVLWIAVAATVAGTVGGALEQVFAQGTAGYKVGVVLASLGVDLASLSKLFGGGK